MTDMRKMAPAPMIGWKRFDPYGYIDRATAIARSDYPDAVLVSLQAEEVAPDGTVDTTIAGAQVTYQFRSPGLSVAPSGVAGKPHPCEMTLSISKQGYLSRWDSPTCNDPQLTPHCTPAQLLARAVAKGAPGNTVGNVESVRYDNKGPQWSIWLGNKFYTFDDDCTGTPARVSNADDPDVLGFDADPSPKGDFLDRVAEARTRAAFLAPDAQLVEVDASGSQVDATCASCSTRYWFRSPSHTSGACVIDVDNGTWTTVSWRDLGACDQPFIQPRCKPAAAIARTKAPYSAVVRALSPGAPASWLFMATDGTGAIVPDDCSP
jgi:hypothetical protein